MEKILLVTDATAVNIQAVDFACYIARLTRSRLTGIFLENMLQAEIPVTRTMHGLTYIETLLTDDIPVNEDKKALCRANAKLFADACENRGVNCNLHHHVTGSVSVVLHESRYADLLIIDPATSFKEHDAVPSRFTREVLSGVECPVLVAPFSFDAIDEILFTCDGSASASYAIRQFGYLFPELNDRKVTVLQVNNSGKWNETEKNMINSLLQCRYEGIHFSALKGNTPDVLFDYLAGKTNILVVMGAFGRGAWSVFFKRSVAERLLKTINLPVFIAHH